MPKLTRETWLLAAINQLKEHGPSGISGERIARRLDVTRGSFYHHFSGMDELTLSILSHWEKTLTADIFERALNQQEISAPEAMISLLESAWNGDAELEIAIRQWAYSNALVQQHVEKIDKVRLEKLTAIYSVLSGCKVRGEKLGKIAYYGLLGTLHSWPRFSRDQLKTTILEIQELLLEPPLSPEGIKLSQDTF
jgi:AcrR family transcriptional regulator